VFQQFNLLARTSALGERRACRWSTQGVGGRERKRRRATLALTRVGLSDRLEHNPNQFSGGQQQRVAIARSIVNEPKVVLADEPTGALDSRTSVEVMAIFQELWRTGITVLLVTHEPDVAEFASRVVVMRDGHHRLRPIAASRLAAPATTGGAEREPPAHDACGPARHSPQQARAFFTTLGVVIGVGAVIAMMAIGAGAKAQVEAGLRRDGHERPHHSARLDERFGVHGGFGSMPTLTWDDLAAIRSDVSTVRAAAPTLRSSMAVISEEQNWTTSITGTSPEYFEIRNWPIALGRHSPSRRRRRTKVIVLGQTVVDKLYGPSSNPVGQTCASAARLFKSSALRPQEGQSATGQDYDDAAFVPFTTFAQRCRGASANTCRARSWSRTSSATGARPKGRDRAAPRPAPRGGRRRRRLFDPQPERDRGRSAAGTETMTLLLASVAAVSLLVGGIGIMNIMLVSVTERTREIGIRMAVGAEPQHMLLQFLIEALSLSVAGGLIGVGFGVGRRGVACRSIPLARVGSARSHLWSRWGSAVSWASCSASIPPERLRSSTR
jgi:energy-coupling factor transporter ATP-binding protein EcfA2